MKLTDVVALLDGQLQPDQWQDASHNGLQIANHGIVNRVCTAVDASLEAMQEAVRQEADLLIVHHGLSWKDSLARLTGMNYQLVSFAMTHGLAIYAMHLPLDAHPTLGNNAQIAAALGLTQVEPFMAYHGRKIGFKGLLPKPILWQTFVPQATQILHAIRVDEMPFGKAIVQSVGICSGGAPEGVEQAAIEQLDVYLCGEANLVAYNMAKTLHINALFAGHYATERFGVRALGDWLAQVSGLPVSFLDWSIPY